jgi:hypothetical protein
MLASALLCCLALLHAPVRTIAPPRTAAAQMLQNPLRRIFRGAEQIGSAVIIQPTRNGVDERYPWLFRGRLWFRPAFLPTPPAGALPDGVRALGLLGWTVGGVVALQYDTSPVGPYLEVTLQLWAASPASVIANSYLLFFVSLAFTGGQSAPPPAPARPPSPTNPAAQLTSPTPPLRYTHGCPAHPIPLPSGTQYVSMGAVVSKRGALGQWGSRLYVSSAAAERACVDVWGVPATEALIQFDEDGDSLRVDLPPTPGRVPEVRLSGWWKTRSSAEEAPTRGGLPVLWTPTLKALWAPFIPLRPGDSPPLNLHDLRLSAKSLRLHLCGQASGDELGTPLPVGLSVDGLVIEISERRDEGL